MKKSNINYQVLKSSLLDTMKDLLFLLFGSLILVVLAVLIVMALNPLIVFSFIIIIHTTLLIHSNYSQRMDEERQKEIRR